MQNLLSNREKRHLTLLKILIKSELITLSQASENTGYPTRTLSADIKQINHYIEPSKIVTTTAGIYLDIPTTSSIREIYSNLLEQSREYQLLLFLLEEEPDSLDDFAEALYLSTSTLKRVIIQLNKRLIKHNIQIVPSPFRVDGDEKNISLFFTALLNEANYARNSKMSSLKRDLLAALCSKAAAHLNVELTYQDMVKLVLWTYVRLIRLRQQHHMPVESIAQNMPSLNDKAFTDTFYSVFGVRLLPEILFEIFYLYTHTGYAHTIYDMEKITENSKYHKKLYTDIQTMLKNIATILDISLEDTDHLFLDLFNILQISSAPIYILYDKSEVFSTGFCRENKTIYNPVVKIIEDTFSQRFKKTGLDAVIYLLLTHWPGLTKKVSENAPEIIVGIFLDTDIEHSRLIADLLERYSKIDVSIIMPTPTSGYQYDELCQDVDILLTNLPSLNIACPELICIQEYPSAKDWRNILLAIEKVYSAKVSQ